MRDAPVAGRRRRLDDLNAKVDAGFADLRAEIRGLRGELGGPARRSRGAAPGEINDRFDRMQRAMLLFAGGMFAALAGLFALVLTQL